MIRRLFRALGRRPCHRAGCGHPLHAHRHHRTGSDCSLCACPAYHRRIGGRR